MLFYGDNCLAAVYRKGNRITVKNISVTGLLFNDFVISVRKRLRHHESAGAVCVVYVYVQRRRIVDMLYDIFAGIGVSYLKADSRRRNNPAGFNILFYNLNERLKCGVINKIAIGLAVILYKNIKSVHQLFSVQTFGLLYGINAVGKVFGLCKAIFIAYKNIPFVFLCGVIAAGGFKEHLKFRACFGCFNLRLAVIAVLDYSDFSFLYGFKNFRPHAVIFRSIELCLCSDMV